MKKTIKKLTAVILMILMVFSLSGCAILDSKLNDIKGDLIGNSYTIRTYDNYGSIVMTATGDRINIVGNPVETTSYSSDGQNDIYSYADSITDWTSITGVVNKYKNMFGKSRVVVIKSQLGQPITAYSGDKVYWEIPDDLPKMTKLMIDGKPLYIHRANFQIIDTELLD